MKKVLKQLAVLGLGAFSLTANAQTEMNEDLIFVDDGTSTEEVIFGNSGTNDWAIEKYKEGLNFWKKNGTNSGDFKLFINKYGNVGINTQGASTRALDVKGAQRWDDVNDSRNYDVVFDWSGTSNRACFWSTIDGKMDLGKDWARFNKIYTYSINTDFVTTDYINASRDITANNLRYYFECTKLSDKRMKKDIVPINNVMSRLNSISSYTYRLNDRFYETHPNFKGNKDEIQYGFLAQELQAAFPEVVNEYDSNGTLGVDYVAMVPILLQAIKEQDEKIVALQSQTSSSTILLNRIEQLEKQIATLSNNNGKMKSGFSEDEFSADETELKLYANSPNPFREETVIEMSIPEMVENAVLAVYDLTGKQIMTLDVDSRGETFVKIEGNKLEAGMYLYSLIADGKLIDTKNMVVTE